MRDALLHDQREWHEVITQQLRRAGEAGEIPDMDMDLATFQIDAVLCAADTALQQGDADAADEARRAVEGLLGCRRSAPGATRRASSPS